MLTERLFTLTQRAVNKVKLVEEKTGSLEKIFDLVDVSTGGQGFKMGMATGAERD